MKMIAAVLVLGAALGCAGPGGAPGAPPLRVMSYNIRYGTAKDGEHAWELRKDLCASRAAAFAPDLLGLQEALGFQNAHFLAALPGYAALGVAREDGKEKGEHTTILYRKGRLDLVESGTFWLSETPDVAGSKSWDSSLPRIATWAVFRDLAAGGREVLALNTHFDHKGPQARIESAKQIRAFLSAKAKGRPVVVTGDFNAGPGSEPHRALAGPGAPDLVDVFAALHPEPGIATGHGWRGEHPGVRIDWILCTRELAPLDAGIDLHREGTRWPSDHFPVHAQLGWR